MYLSRLLFVLAGVSFAVFAIARGAGDGDLPDEVRALIKREEAKGLTDPNRRRAAQNKDNNDGGGDGGCNMEIGNSNSGGKSGTAPRQVTTIITGPVIQMNNKCK
ncbi:MAG: hypothetical protein ACKVQT_34870 [Burkholderiales bacterium]